MPMFKAIIHIPGGKELKVENNQVPDELYHALQRVVDPEIIDFYEGPLQLTDELHAKLHKPKDFRTYVVYRLPYGADPEGDEAKEFLLDGIRMANIVTKIESVFSYQILKLEFIYADDYETDYLKDAPKDDAA